MMFTTTYTDREIIDIIDLEYDKDVYIGKALGIDNFDTYLGTVSHIYENSEAGEQIYVLTNQTADHTLNVDNPATNAVPYTASESEPSP
ncbi:hypothetical protein ACVR05_08045 [Streptococcus caprae]|uniref:DUF4926 domain-containing protein n=1 Tax=Streptococcus caprae TaxID=1640501 RepID=A0ABV8CT31_9STRE